MAVTGKPATKHKFEVEPPGIRSEHPNKFQKIESMVVPAANVIVQFQSDDGNTVGAPFLLVLQLTFTNCHVPCSSCGIPAYL